MKFRRISEGFCLFLGRSLVWCDFFLFRFLRKNATDSQNKNVHHNLFLLRNLNKPRLESKSREITRRSWVTVSSLTIFCKSDIKRWVTPELAVSDPIKDSKCQIEWRKSWFVQWPKHNNHISLVWKNDQVVVWYFLMDATLWDVYCLIVLDLTVREINQWEDKQ